MGVPPHLLVKRKVNYRKKKEKELGCKFCLHMLFMDYKKPEDCFRRRQCHVIGCSISQHSDVEYNYTCNAFHKIIN